MAFIHGLPAWPNFEWDATRTGKALSAVSRRQGLLLGEMKSLGFDLQNEATLQSLTAEVVKSSEIEGEMLDAEQVRSLIAKRLGLEAGGLTTVDRNVEGVVDMTLDATRDWDKPLTEARLFGWHAALFPTGRSGLNKIVVGAWRSADSDPMEVISGAAGKERIHYQAPAAKRVPKQMKAFLSWFESADIDPVEKAAIAHLWFVTIHPFEDGNGRIARAIADLALARSEHSSRRFYSMSAQIRLERRGYYNILEATQRGDLNVTTWLEWFYGCLSRAFDGAEVILEKVLAKSRFWNGLVGEKINERQRDVLNRLLEGFVGKLTSSKWAQLTKTSQDTASRDIEDLVKRGILQKDAAGGWSTSYSLSGVLRRE